MTDFVATTDIIDAHLHLWDLGAGGYGWLGPQHGELNRSFSAGEAHSELTGAGVSGAIVVQADDTAADTDFMLATAQHNTWIAGVVGWVPLDDQQRAGEELDRLCAEPKFRGIRHLVHNDPRPDFLALPAVRTSLKEAARRGLAFDVPDAWPRHLGAAVELARALPGLTVVLDHLGKPPLGSGGSEAGGADLESWRQQFRALAELPNTVAKVSGLQLPGVPQTPEALHKLWEEAVESFGPDRLMFGGDWPVSTLAAPYAETAGVLFALADELSVTERQDFLTGTARRVYGLPAP
ncbi:amidohydrolase family protein [Pseudarthrobacter sp. N5]|uniref:amidohydrolase family protein n=1 Tax=Pseudarthrobacter sp. N5 TaxID=3418416 RepID=UPI003CEE1AF5